MRNPRAFTQVLVTRFSVRLDGESVIRGHSTDWLFSEDRIRRRLTLFGNLTLPSILKSTVKPEHYIIVVDSELPKYARAALDKLVEPFPWIVIHTWVPGTEWFKLGWILDVIDVRTPYVLTGQIDDDDALELGSNERMRMGVKQHLDQQQKTLWMWFGSNNAWEWDLDVHGHDMGFLKPYSGGTTYWQGVGLSLLVPNQKDSPTSYTWSHSVLQMIFAPFWKWKKLRLKRVFRSRMGLIKRLVVSGNVKWLPSLVVRGWLYDAGVRHPAEVDMLISNSGTNLQNKRIALGQDARWTEGMLEELERFGVTEQSAKAIAQVFHSGTTE